MDFYDVIKKRRSIRKYTSTSVPESALQRILNAIVQAPTAVNKQPFKFMIIKEPENVLKNVIRQDWALKAPIVIVAFAIESEAWTRKYDGVNYAFVDVAIAFDHLTLAATAEGLATCWIAANDPTLISHALDVPDTWKYVALTPLGYPAEDATKPKRKDLEEIVLSFSG